MADMTDSTDKPGGGAGIAAGMDQAGKDKGPQEHNTGAKVGEVLRESGDVGDESPSGGQARQDIARGMDEAGKGRAG